jgi:hypothetical protein
VSIILPGKSAAGSRLGLSSIFAVIAVLLAIALYVFGVHRLIAYSSDFRFLTAEYVGQVYSREVMQVRH